MSTFNEHFKEFRSSNVGIMTTNPRLLLFLETICCCLLWYLLLFHVFPLTWYFFLLYYICKSSEKLFYKAKYDALPLGNIDALWLRDNPTNRIVINALLTVQGDIDLSQFKNTLIKKLRLEDESEDNPFSKAKKRLLKGFFHCYWVENTTFAISDHVKLWPQLVHSEKELRELVSKLCVREMDMTKSPWEYNLISFLDKDKIFKTGLLVRLHHCLADGISLANFLINELSDSVVETTPLRKFSERNRLLMNIKGLFWGPYFMINMMTTARDESILHGGELTGTKAVTWSEAIDLDIVKDIKNKALCTVNDVLVSALSGTLVDFFRKQDLVPTADVKVSIPIDLRANMGDGALKFQNKLTVIIFELPTKLHHPLLQLKETKIRTKEIKTSGEPFFMGIALEVMTSIMPSKFLDPLNRFFCQKTTAVLSNVPGPQNPITICGRPLDMLTFWAPPRDNIGISFSFGTYANQLIFGVQSDTGLLQDPDEICQLFHGNLLELHKSMNDVNANVDNMVTVNINAQ